MSEYPAEFPLPIGYGPDCPPEEEKLLPIKSDAGNNTVWSGPTNKRARCCTIKPTKPIMPLIATEEPPTSIDAKIRGNRIFRSTISVPAVQVCERVICLDNKNSQYRIHRYRIIVNGKRL